MKKYAPDFFTSFFTKFTGLDIHFCQIEDFTTGFLVF